MRPGRTAPFLAAAGVLYQVSLVLLGLGALPANDGIVAQLRGSTLSSPRSSASSCLGEQLTSIQTTGAVLALTRVMLVSC